MSETIFLEKIRSNKIKVDRRLPDKREAEDFVDNLFEFLFVNGVSNTNAEVTAVRYAQLKDSFASLVEETENSHEHIRQITATFFDEIPDIYSRLYKDAEAILQFDPAANDLFEVIVAYPGFFATVIYRISHQLWVQGLRLLPRLLSEYAHSRTGIDIHPGATIGTEFAIDHGTGIVIGETTVIGNRVKIYQGVTLGALNVNKATVAGRRHPVVGDDVVIYSGATILGGNTVIGAGSIIGGNVWITNSIPGGSVVYHKSEVHIKDKNPFPEPINFII